MPQERRKSKQAKTAFDFTDEKHNIPSEEAAPSKQRKRLTHDYSEDESDIENEVPTAKSETGAAEAEMSSLLTSFGADISKTLSTKRKRLATFTSASLKTSNKKYEELFATQQAEREKMKDEFGKQIGSVFTQWENDIQKAKDAEEKLETIIRQLQKTLQQQRVVQNQRLKSLKTLHDQYTKGTSELSTVHHEQQVNIHSELRKELCSMQKKMMDDARQEEISNVRKSLQTMLSQV